MHNTTAMHDLRIAVHTMLACAQMIEIEAQGAAPQMGEYARMLGENARSASRLLESALEKDCAAHFTLSSAPGDAVALLQNLARQFAPAARQSGIMLAFESASPAIFFSFDADKLERIAANLLSNALRHARRQVILRTRVFSGWFMLEVVDDGAGFTQDPLAQPPHGDGHGLGLREARHFARLHGGMLRASRMEGCTIFRAALPLHENMQDESEENAIP